MDTNTISAGPRTHAKRIVVFLILPVVVTVAAIQARAMLTTDSNPDAGPSIETIESGASKQGSTKDVAADASGGHQVVDRPSLQELIRKKQ